MLSTTKKIKFTDKDYKIGSIINWMDKGLKAEEPQDIVDNLNPTENWEASEEAHGASNQAKLGLSCHLGEWTKEYVRFFLVSLYLCAYQFVPRKYIRNRSITISFHPDVLLNLIIGRRVKENVDFLQRSVLQHSSWNKKVPDFFLMKENILRVGLIGLNCKCLT